MSPRPEGTVRELQWRAGRVPVHKENLMKKTPKKLTLARETVVKLAAPDLGKVAGGIVYTDDPECMQQNTVLNTW
jgi:hypothetical protein